MHLTMDYARIVQTDRLREAAAYRLAAEARRARPRRRWQPTRAAPLRVERVAPQRDGCVAC